MYLQVQLKPWAGESTSGLSSHRGLIGNKLRRCRNIRELCLHKQVDNCSMKWQQAKAMEAPLLLVVLTAISLKVLKLAGDQSPSVSTARGIKIPPAPNTASSWWASFSTSPRDAATPAVTAD